ncbi:hypothetical protein [Marininema halotolerans]|nr:hypothetical protein [Marininema halotolerans]
MTVQEMIEWNNARRKTLSDEGLSYYEEMLVYIRSSWVPEKQGEELLLEILEHLIEAEGEGRSVDEVFGDHPEVFCKETIAALPKRSLGSWVMLIGTTIWTSLTWMLGIHAGLGILIMIVGQWVSLSPNIKNAISNINAWSFIEIAFLVFISIVIIFMVLKKEIVLLEMESSVKNKIKFSGILLMVWLLFYSVHQMLPPVTIPMSPWISGALFILGWLGQRWLWGRVE